MSTLEDERQFFVSEFRALIARRRRRRYLKTGRIALYLLGIVISDLIVWLA